MAKREALLLKHQRATAGSFSTFLKPLLEAIPEGALLVRGDGDVVSANSTARRVIDSNETSRSESRFLRSLVQMALSAIQSQSVENRPLDDWQFSTSDDSEFDIADVRAIPLLLNHEPMALLLLKNCAESNHGDGHAESFHGLVGRHPRMTAVYDVIREVGPLDVRVLIQGQSGTGKELVARALHQVSPRASKNLVAMNCSALSDGVLESELFGHVRGAFSGAIRDRKGRFELADGGTLFLDEIGELSPVVQAKLLRVLQDGSFERVGDSRTQRADARIISATNRNLENEIAGGRCRADLFYRLAVMVIQLPSLTERRSDIPLLADHLIAKAARDFGMDAPPIDPEVIAVLQDFHWPGNVRQLENVMRHALIRSGGQSLQKEHLPPSLIRRAAACEDFTMKRQNRLTRRAVSLALGKVGGNRSQAAKVLGVSRATLYRFLSDNTASV